MASEFRLQIKQWRLDAGLTQDELAARLGVKQQTISDWESGRARPTVTRAPDIARHLGVDQGTFLEALAEQLDDELTEARQELRDNALDAVPALKSSDDGLHRGIDRLPPADRARIKDMVERLLGEPVD